MITQDELKRLLHYDPETGDFTWLVARKGTLRCKTAGTKHNRGYRTIHLNYKCYLAHRLAWLYMMGDWPKHTIDHINGIRDDNRWSNLREATRQENNFNSSSRKLSSSVYKGVFWAKRNKKWISKINFNNKQIHIGYFDCEIEAAKAYNEEAKKRYGDFANLNPV